MSENLLREGEEGNDDRSPQTLVVTSSALRDHVTGHAHPESPARIDAVNQALARCPGRNRFTVCEAQPIPAGVLDHVHDNDYLTLAEREIKRGARQLSTGDTSVCEDSWNSACLAAGALTMAVDEVVERRVANAFCAIRPPGHHATANRGMGFCVVNNVAVAARYAQKKHGIDKVLIVDWDVHHGNGTQDIFYDDGSVFFFSTHQHPWYPGTGMADETGTGKGLGTTCNVPLSAGANRDAVLGAFEACLLPAAEAFKPEFVMISAGFDSRRGDPLGDFLLDDSDFADLTRMVSKIADEFADGRLLSTLEGGYSLAGLASATTAHVDALAACASRN